MMRSTMNRVFRSQFGATGLRSKTAFQSFRPALAQVNLQTRPFASDNAMFCFQCEQTEGGTGCTTVGVCGKTPETAGLQDLLMDVAGGISEYAAKAQAIDSKYVDDAADRFLNQSLFSTLTNVNFDASRFVDMLKQAEQHRKKYKALYLEACEAKSVTPESVKDEALPQDFDMASLMAQAKTVGVEERKARLGDDVNGLTELARYGLKGAIAYWEHACRLGAKDEAINAEFHRIMAALHTEEESVDGLLKLAMDVGALNLKVTELLEKGHVQNFGTPTPTQVNITPVEGKCILVSGHDLPDLEALLKQTEGTGINVYTHGEMLPAHAYPEFQKYKHLVGHYGGPWQLQKMEFNDFPGPILMTSNCLVEPRKKYRDRMFTTNVTGFEGVKHVEDFKFQAVIDSAQANEGYTAADIPAEPATPLMTGFHKDAILGVADKVIAAVEGGDIQRFFVIGGCDGAERERTYFTQLAKDLPQDTVVLTLGCAKYRFNRLPMGDIGGIPRVLDMGQCNDSFGAVQVAVALANHFKTDVNSLPLSFALSWFEQKAVAVLLTLLHLNIQNIRIGPALPAFATPAMLDILVDKFQLKPTGDSTEDLASMLKGQ